MSSKFATALAGWRRNPAKFVEAACVNPETRKPFVLLPAERAFFKRAFEFEPDGRLRYPEQIFAAPKKSGKTTFAALHLLATVILFGGRHAEAYCVADIVPIGRIDKRAFVSNEPVLNHAKELITLRVGTWIISSQRRRGCR